MMLEEPSFFEVGFKIACGAFAGLVSWVWSGIVDDMKSIHRELDEIKDKHADFRIYSEREFEKRESTQLSLSRIHDRIDELIQTIAKKP